MEHGKQPEIKTRTMNQEQVIPKAVCQAANLYKQDIQPGKTAKNLQAAQINIGNVPAMSLPLLKLQHILIICETNKYV